MLNNSSEKQLFYDYKNNVDNDNRNNQTRKQNLLTTPLVIRIAGAVGKKKEN